MRNLRLLLPILLVLLPLKGCKVPDIKPFAGATTEMTTAVDAGFDQVLGDLDATTKLDIQESNQQALVAQRAIFAQEAANMEQVLSAFDSYASTLVELSEAGEKGQASINKVADAIQGIAAAFPPAAPAGSVVALAIKEISDRAQTIRTLHKLADAMNQADAAIQKAATTLQANIGNLLVVDKAAGNIVDAQLRGANQNTLQAYTDLRLRQDRADWVTGLIVQFENTVARMNSGDAAGPSASVFQQALFEQLVALAKLDTEIVAPKKAENLDAARLKTMLALLSRREVYWRKLVDYGISSQFQSRYDKVQAALADNELRMAQHRSILTKSRALLETWASSHMSMKIAVTDEKHSVSFQEVVAAAKNLKEFIDKLQTLKSS
jgi:hypothetical protein